MPSLARERIFNVVLQEATTSGILLCCIMRTRVTSHRDLQTVDCMKQRQQSLQFSCHIAMSKRQRLHFFYVISRGSKQQYNNTKIAICQELQFDDEMQQSNIICCQAQEAMTTRISLMLQCKRSNDIIFLILQEAVVLPGSMRRQ
jgi:hypothetical protein